MREITTIILLRVAVPVFNKENHKHVEKLIRTQRMNERVLFLSYQSRYEADAS